MKKGLAFFVPLALILSFCAPAFSQQNEKSMETVLIDNFDTEGEMEWTWKIQASRFIADGYPLISYFDGISNSLLPFVKEGEPAPKVLGGKVKYKRKGDNWFEIYPSKDDKPFEIPFRGNVSQLDFWVWGSDYLYFMDILVRDAEGSVHIIPAGNLKFYGWKNIILKIPGYLRQSSSYHSFGNNSMTFVGFRFRADSAEHADDFSVFIDKLQYTAAGITHVYDGYNLNSVDFGEKTDSGNASGTANAGNKTGAGDGQ